MTTIERNEKRTGGESMNNNKYGMRWMTEKKVGAERAEERGDEITRAH
jgi:hypothetical protein